MKLVVLAGLISTLLPLAIGQDNAERKHLTVPPLNGGRAVALSALSIERGVSYPSVVKLKGNVEIKTPVCLPVGENGAMVCDGEMIVRADTAEFDESTGEIQAHGNVTVTPLRHKVN
jgi:hypothetical protein